MPLFDTNGTKLFPIGKLYDNNGTKSFPIGKVFDNDGTKSRLIYTAEETHTLTYKRTQDNEWDYKEKQNTGGFTTVRFTAFTPGMSYGSTDTKVEIIRKNSDKTEIVVKTLANVNRTYWVGEDGNGHTYNGTKLQLNTDFTIQNGDYIRLSMRADYSPSVSGQHESSCSVTFIFS